MANSPSSPGGDYSFLIHSIEGNLERHVPSKDSLSFQSGRSPKLTPFLSARRPRDSIGSALSDDRCFKYLRSSSKTFESDELKLEIEKLKEENRSLKSDHERTELKFMRQIEFLESENSDLKKKLSDKTDDYFESKKKSQAAIRELESTIARLRTFREDDSKGDVKFNLAPASVSKPIDLLSKLDATENQLQKSIEENFSLRSQNLDLLQKNSSLEQSLKQLQAVQQDQGKDKDLLQDRQYRESLSSLESKLRIQGKELASYEKRIQNQQILEEEARNMSSKLRYAQTTIDSLREIEGKYQILVQEKQQWQSLLSGIFDSLSSIDNTLVLSSPTSSPSPVTSNTSSFGPTSLLRHIQSVQQKYALLVRRFGDMETNYQEATRKLASLQDTYKQLEKSNIELSSSKAVQDRRYQQVQNQIRLYQNEIQSLRSLLSSYQREFQLGKPSLEIMKSLHFKTIEELTNSIQSYEKRVAELEVILQNTSEKPVDAVNTSSEIDDLKTQVQLYSQRWQRSQELLEDLQVFTRTDFIPGKMRILHLRDNPFALRSSKKMANGLDNDSQQVTAMSTIPIDQWKKCRQEKNNLIKEIERLKTQGPSESGGSSSSHLSISMDNSILQSTPAAKGSSSAAGSSSSLNHIDSNKLNLRLKEMFKERISAFREAVFLLTGFKIDLMTDADSLQGIKRLRLRSMYAESPEDSLLFQWQNDRLELLETPFALNLDSHLVNYLQQCNSIPAFLSSVTLQLFENQTFMG